MKRIKLVHGSARVSENITNQTIEALNKLSVLAYNNKPKQCDIHVVVKSFYCYENLANGKEKCSNECADCTGIKPMQ
jgi:hypothetical protein